MCIAACALAAWVIQRQHSNTLAGLCCCHRNHPQLDKINHQVASRVAGAFTTFKQYDKARQAAMVAQLRRIAATEGLSENVFEIVSKSLQQV